MTADTPYWLAFSAIKGLGAVRFRKLLAYFGTLANAWAASELALQSAGLSSKITAQIVEQRKSTDPEALQGILEKKGISVLTWEDNAYPRFLREIDQPPPVLYYKGTITPEDELAVAIVGTRNVTAYGRQLTKDTAAYLAGNGCTIVSGLARGVDAIAHRAALEILGRTLAVLGSGVDVIYPPEHRELAEAIAQHGAVISDYPPGTKPDGINFPPRNRIISGLSRATVVIEAGEKSGALITAKFAAEQGREVFAVPGSVLSPMSKGTNNLLGAGATPMTSPAAVLTALQVPVQMGLLQNNRPTLEPFQQKVVSLLGHESMHIDEICNRLSISIERLTAELTMMELSGIVERAEGMEYRVTRTWKI